MTGLMKMNKKFVYASLDKVVPNPVCELNYTKDYELVISVMLSAQTTDKRVNEVTERLYKKYPTLNDLNNASLEEIENDIKKIGIYRNKSKNLKEIVAALIELGKVPNNRAALESLSGVGRKTASVILSELFDIPAMPVDTHVERVSKRLGFADKDDSVVTVEKKLCKLFDKDKWNKLHKQLVLFGRYHCTSRNPKCEICPFKEKCLYYKNRED